jgi:hypothetical protein
MEIKPGESSERYRVHPELWRTDLNMHKHKLQGMRNGSDRWRYICSHEVAASHCDHLINYCSYVGLEVVKDKLDWKALREALAAISVKPDCSEEVEVLF